MTSQRAERPSGSRDLNVYLPFDLLGMAPKETIRKVDKDLGASIFFAFPMLIKFSKQLSCVMLEEWSTMKQRI